MAIINLTKETFKQQIMPIMKIRFLLQRANLRSFPYKEEVSWGSFYGYLSRLSDYSMYAS